MQNQISTQENTCKKMLFLVFFCSCVNVLPVMCAKCCDADKGRDYRRGIGDAIEGFFVSSTSKCYACDPGKYFRRYETCPLSHQLGGYADDFQICSKCPVFAIANTKSAENYKGFTETQYISFDYNVIPKPAGSTRYPMPANVMQSSAATSQVTVAENSLLANGVRCYIRCSDAFNTLSINTYSKDDLSMYDDSILLDKIKKFLLGSGNGIFANRNGAEVMQRHDELCQQVPMLNAEWHFTQDMSACKTSNYEHCNAGVFALPHLNQCRLCPRGYTRIFEKVPTADDIRKQRIVAMYGENIGNEIWKSMQPLAALQNKYHFPWVDHMHWEVCEPCAIGTVQVELQDLKTNKYKLVPQDVLDDSLSLTNEQTLEIWRYCNYRCRACSVGEGIQRETGQTACTKCDYPSVQIMTQQTISFYNLFKADGSNDDLNVGNGFFANRIAEKMKLKEVQISLMLGTQCSFCADGFQHYQAELDTDPNPDSSSTWFTTMQCRQASEPEQGISSARPYFNCCKPCSVNTRRPVAGTDKGKCIITSKPSRKPFASLQHDVYENGCPYMQGASYCTAVSFAEFADQQANEDFAATPKNNPCVKTKTPRSIAAQPWHTCVECGQTEYFVEDEKLSTCEACKSKIANVFSYDVSRYQRFLLDSAPYSVDSMAFILLDNLAIDSKELNVGEYRDWSENTCKTCDSCSYLSIDYSLTDFAEIKNQAYQQMLRSYFVSDDTTLKFRSNSQSDSYNLLLARTDQDKRFGYQRLTATCTPLQTLSVIWTNSVSNFEVATTAHWTDTDFLSLVKLHGQIEYKSKHAAQNDRYRVFHPMVAKPYFTVVESLTADGKQCTARHCQYVCNGADILQFPELIYFGLYIQNYQYAKGCASQSLNELYMLNNNDFFENAVLLLDVLKKETSNSFLQQHRVLQSGICTRCKLCEKKHFNPFCNKYGYTENGQIVSPEGTCKQCLTIDECTDNKYLHHPVRFAGCERYANPGEFDNVHNYECKACPTLLQVPANMAGKFVSFHPNALPQVAGLYVVAGCGKQYKYNYFQMNAFGTFIKSHEIIDISHSVNYEDNFRDFLPFFSLQPVCPLAYFWDEDASSLCKLDGTTAIEKEGVIMYFNGYHGFKEETENSIDANLCCQPCRDCSVGENLKRDINFQRCTGTTTSDTQQNGCVSRCSTGTYEDSNECRACSVCLGEF